MTDPEQKQDKLIFWGLGAILCGLLVYLVAAHYVKAYSDPISFLFWAEDLLEGHPNTNRTLLYPAVLDLLIQAMGRSWVFLSNLPFLLAMIGLLYWVTYLAVRECKEGKRCATLTAFLSVALLVIPNPKFFLEMQNPFREPVAFSLLLAGMGLLLSGKKLGGARALGVGLLLGLAVSARETCIIFVPFFFLWLLGLACRGRKWKLLRYACGMGAGLFLGMSPLFVQNYMHSSNPVVPGYASKKVDRLVQKQEWDIPIPGMSIHNFHHVGPKVVQHMVQKYRWYGIVFWLFGVFMCLKKRAPFACLVLLPTTLINLLFYSFYWYRKERYIFVAELTTTPMMAMGAVLLCGVLFRVLGRPLRPWDRWPQRILVLISCLLVANSLNHAWADRRAHALKVWNIPEFQEFIRPKLEAPYHFVGGRHVTYMLTWLMEAEEPYEFLGDYDVKKENILESGFTSFMSAIGVDLLDRFSQEQYYRYGDGTKGLLRRWFDFNAAADFSDSPVPIARYGKPLTETLYHISPWQAHSVERHLPGEDALGPYVLAMDLFSLWDYPDRTRCEVTVNGVPPGGEPHQWPPICSAPA